MRPFAAAVVLSLSIPALAGTLREPLPQVLAEAGPDEKVPVSIVFRSQASPAELGALADRHETKAARRAALATRLKAVAIDGQRGVLQLVRGAEAAGRAARVRPLWISSIVGADLTPDLVRAIAARPEVDHVNWNPKADVFLGERASRLEAAPDAPTITADEIECGTDRIRAPEVWSSLGITGAGAVVAVIDTGVCYNHPDIANQIWVNPGEDLNHNGVVMDAADVNGIDDDGNGFVDDFIGWDFDVNDNNPNDDSNGHGSHCAGSVGGDGTSGTQAGVAPDVKIMPVRVGVSFADEVDVWSAMQYAAENGADAISMSLGWPHNQNPDRPTWRANAENTINLGTAMVIAAGNEGSGAEPDNVRTPGDVPRVITVGAVDCADAVAGFSSRGPVTWQGVAPYNDYPYPPGLVKPDVAAPGVDTKSHNFCSGYTLMSGTSMATPHTAGAVALMVSANPGLTHDEIKSTLESTAVELGAPGKDNEYGSGRIDAYEAVAAVAGPLGYESHTVSDAAPAYGNNDGNIDAGETVTVSIVLRNKNAAPATQVWGIVSTTSPDVDVVDGVVFWPDLAGNATAASVAPHFTFKVRQGCGQNVRFKLQLFSGAGDKSYAGFSVRIGLRQDTTFFQDDMEIDRGWSVSGTEVANNFVRQDPKRVALGDGTVIQPEDDAGASPEVLAWVTGNPNPKGNFDPATGDVDQEALLTSPAIDATSGDNLTLEYARWFYLGFPSSFDTSHFEVQVSGNNGASYTTVERLEAGGGGWVNASVPVSVAASSQMRIRVRVKQERTIGGTGDTLLEGLIDDVRLYGFRYLCDAFTAPAASRPNPVGNTVLASRHADGVRLDWTAPPVDAGHAAATSYRIYRSALPSGGFAVGAQSTAAFHVATGENGNGVNRYWLVVAVNGGGDSGDVPTP
jgi:serine protease AprX